MSSRQIIKRHVCLNTGRYLDALSLGEETAASLGFGPSRWRWTVVGGVACAVGAAVSVSGNIGFVGLVVPHLLRPLVGHRPRALLWASALGGAVLLLLADVIVQIVSGRVELKLGVITALIGGPFFRLMKSLKHISQADASGQQGASLN